MARISEVIHVKGTDGEVRECALFDSSSDIPSPAEAREFGLDGAKIYGAVLRGNVFSVRTDEQWLLENSGTELAFHDGSSMLRLLTTPYFVRPKAETLEFGADGGTVYLEDYSFKTEFSEGILSTNGTLSGYSCDRDFISFVNAGSSRVPAWTVVCEANTTADERTFTLALTFLFADGSTRDITFSGTQAAGEETWLRVDPDSLTFDGDGGSQKVSVDSSTGDFSVGGTSGTWMSASKAKSLQGEISCRVRVSANTDASARSGTVTLVNDDGCEAEVAVTQEAGVTPVPGETRTLTINVTKGGAATTDGDWSLRNAPMVTVLADGAVVTGSSLVDTDSMTWTGTTDDGAQVTYTVSKDGYTTVTGSVTMDEDTTVSVRLSPDNNY